jgi:hypothetical protein
MRVPGVRIAMKVPVTVQVARLVPAGRETSATERRCIIESLQTAAQQKAVAGPYTERSQDFLYDEAGLPV